MSEIVSNSDGELDLSVLDAVYMDPAVRSFLSLFEAYNKEPQPDQLDHIIQFAQATYGILFDRTAKLSGNVRTAQFDSDWCETGVRYLEDLDIKIIGFFDEPTSDDMSENCKVAFVIEHEEPILISDSDSHSDSICYYVMPHEVTSLEFNNLISTARAEPWLEYYTPEIAATLSKLTEDIGSNGEVNLIGKLSEYRWQLAGEFYNSVPEDDFINKTERAFQLYIDSLMSMDDLGYIVELDGEVLVQDTDGEFVQKSIQCSTLANEMSVCIRAVTDESSTVFTPYVEMLLHSSDKNAEPLAVLSRPQTIKSLYPLRDLTNDIIWG